MVWIVLLGTCLQSRSYSHYSYKKKFLKINRMKGRNEELRWESKDWSWAWVGSSTIHSPTAIHAYNMVSNLLEGR